MNIKMKLATAGFIAGICSVGMGSQALAQSPEANGDIIVTAQRTETLASKTPVAITALSGDTLRAAGVTNPTELQNLVPNFSMVRGDGLQITIRGITSSDTTEKGDPSAAFLLDGIYIARPQAQEVSFFDIGRIEVLRGPQGTLYGRNTTAGVVNVISNRPKDEFEAAANATVANFDTRQADGMINVPVSDLLSLRFAGSYDRRDSYLIAPEGETTKDNPFKDNLSGRGQALFTFLPDMSLLLRAEYSRMRGISLSDTLNGHYYASLDPADPGYADQRYIGHQFSSGELRERQSPNIAPRTRNHSLVLSGEYVWDFGPMTLTYLGAYQKFRRNDVTSLGGIASGAKADYRQTSHELRFATNNIDRLTLQFGGYFFDEKAKIDAYALDIFGIPFNRFYQNPVKSQNYAAFGQATYEVMDGLRLTLGGRYSHDKKSRVGTTFFQQSPVFDPDTDLALANSAAISSSKFTWRAGLDHDLNERTLIYGSVATGYKAGGFTDGCLDGTTTNGVVCNQPVPADLLFYKPETLKAYEVGVKTRMLDNAIRLNASAFYYDYTNMQLSTFKVVNNAVLFVIANASSSTVKGIEVEANIVPSSRNRVDLSFNYLDAKFDKYFPLGEGSEPDFAGRPLDRSPKVTASASYTYTYPFINGANLAFNVRTRLSDSYVLSSYATGQQFRQPSYTQSDASLRYSALDDRWYAEVFVKNIENEIVVTNVVNFAGVAVTPGDPRTYGARMGFRF
ncbi:TonB-dependent receptor [Sphingopyxis sp.]|uniref:TonB-dependent receptor n=1 Tax=Sphingopyxis sp. TaxID=1908224 RepID=UPI002D794B86|nr:TonB-dependent receptor [Sphingopyxis sp.]HET6522876.1 TonB-dependent receptor [Sphingopyxis sp.]